jgi:hypothetical protein
VCQQKNKERVHAIDEEYQDTDESEYELIHSVHVNSKIATSVYAQLNLEKQDIIFQIDTGAKTNLIPIIYVQHLRAETLHY